jgi:hypothetical protein
MHIEKYISLHVKCPVFDSGFDENCSGSRNVSETPQYQSSWKPIDWFSSCSMFTNYLYMALQSFCWTLAPYQFLDLFTLSVGLLGRGISTSQGRYLHTGPHRHPCLKLDSNPGSQCLSWGRPHDHCDRLVYKHRCIISRCCGRAWRTDYRVHQDRGFCFQQQLVNVLWSMIRVAPKMAGKPKHVW